MIFNAADFQSDAFKSAHSPAKIGMKICAQFICDKRRTLFGRENNVIKKIGVGHLFLSPNKCVCRLLTQTQNYFLITVTPDSARAASGALLYRLLTQTGCRCFSN